MEMRSWAIRRGGRRYALVVTTAVSECTTPLWDRGRTAVRPYENRTVHWERHAPI
jgi:hypothetical protein